MKIFSFITLPALIAALVATTNVFTEITKKIISAKRPKLVVVLWACFLSVSVCIVAAIMEAWTLWWMLLLAGICGLLIGGLVAYAAMFGYDELYAQVITIFQKLIDYRSSGKGGDGGAESD